MNVSSVVAVMIRKCGKMEEQFLCSFYLVEDSFFLFYKLKILFSLNSAAAFKLPAVYFSIL